MNACCLSIFSSLLTISLVVAHSSMLFAQGPIQIYSCNTGNGCNMSQCAQTATVDTGACGSGAVFTCKSTPSLCVDLYSFSNSSCLKLSAVSTSVCGACQYSSSVLTYYRVTCTNNSHSAMLESDCNAECANCQVSAQIAANCSLFPLSPSKAAFVKVISEMPYACEAIGITRYANANCTGNLVSTDVSVLNQCRSNVYYQGECQGIQPSPAPMTPEPTSAPAVPQPLVDNSKIIGAAIGGIVGGMAATAVGTWVYGKSHGWFGKPVSANGLDTAMQ